MKKHIFLKTTFLLGSFLSFLNIHAKAFFDGDVWEEPERPFLFYGIVISFFMYPAYILPLSPLSHKTIHF